MTSSRDEQNKSKNAAVKQIIIRDIARAEHVEPLEALKIVEPYLKYATAGAYLADSEMILIAQKKHIDRLATEIGLIGKHFTGQLTELSNISNDACPQSHLNMIQAFDNVTPVIINDIFGNNDKIDNNAKQEDSIRLIVLKRWIEVIKSCMKNNDFHSASAIFTALNSASIERLKALLMLLSPEEKKYLEFINEKLAKDQGWALMANCYLEKKPFIPTFAGIKKTHTRLDEIRKTRNLEASYLKEHSEKNLLRDEKTDLPQPAAANTKPTSQKNIGNSLNKFSSKKIVGSKAASSIPEPVAPVFVPKNKVFEYILELINAIKTNTDAHPAINPASLSVFQRKLLGHPYKSNNNITEFTHPVPDRDDLGLTKIVVVEADSYRTAVEIELVTIPTSIGHFKEKIKAILEDIKKTKGLGEPVKSFKKELKKTGKRISPDAKVKSLTDLFNEIFNELNTSMHTKLQSLKHLISSLEKINKAALPKKDVAKHEQLADIISHLTSILSLATRYERLIKTSGHSKISSASSGAVETAASSQSLISATDSTAAMREVSTSSTSLRSHRQLADSQRKLTRSTSYDFNAVKPPVLKRSQSARNLYSNMSLHDRQLLIEASLQNKGIRTPRGAISPHILRTSSSELDLAAAAAEAFSMPPSETPTELIANSATVKSGTPTASLDTLAESQAPLISTADSPRSETDVSRQPKALKRRSANADKGEGLPLKGSKIRNEVTCLRGSSSGSGLYAPKPQASTPDNSVVTDNKPRKK